MQPAASLAVPAALPVKAIPEYQPVKALLLSEDLFNYGYEAPALLSAITEAGAEAWIATETETGHQELNAKLAALGVPDKALKRSASLVLPHGNIWLRDYGGFPVETRGKNPHLELLDLKFDGAARTMEDFPAAVGRKLALPVRSVPLAIDGGDFLTNGDFCFTSSKDLQKPKDVQAAKEQLGCRELVVFADPPHAHLDMWAKIVDEHTVLVNQLDERTLAVVKYLYGTIPEDIKALADNLDAKAKEWAKYLKVVRLPMPMPYRRTFRTYANSVLVNGTAIVPTYDRFGWKYDDYPDKSLAAYYEKSVRKIYELLNFNVRFINADGLLFNGGAFHCVTAPIPAVKGS